MKYSKLLAATMLAFALTACGGGGTYATEEQAAAQYEQEKMLQAGDKILERIDACSCGTEDPMFTRPDIVSDADLQLLLSYADWMMKGDKQKAEAFRLRVTSAIEYRKNLAAPTVQPTGQTVVMQ